MDSTDTILEYRFRMRPHQFEFGIEKEYAIFGEKDNKIGYLLVVESLLDILWNQLKEDTQELRIWNLMYENGWRIEPEYSHCLVEVVSPPFILDEWSKLTNGFFYIEKWLHDATKELSSMLKFKNVSCTSDYSVRTDLFFSSIGEHIIQFRDILLDSNDKNWLLGDIKTIPSCFKNAKTELLYAGFSSTHVTVHLPDNQLTNSKDINTELLAEYYWYLLRLARQVECEGCYTHAFLQNGENIIKPDITVSIRDALVYWGDPFSYQLLENVNQSLYWSSQELLEKFYEIFKQEPTALFKTNDFDAYTCRPKIIDEIMLFELRCFHSAINLSQLKYFVEDASQFVKGKVGR